MECINYVSREDISCRPTWPQNSGYVNNAHREVFHQTSDIPGWQAEGDTYKLFEMAYFAGEVILEVGMYSGRSAVVQILGALSNPDRQSFQFFSLDTDANAIVRTREVLRKRGLEQHASLFVGNLSEFFSAIPISPTMVFLDADHSYDAVDAELAVLANYLSPGTFVLCHDFTNVENETGEYGVVQACDKWEKLGYFRFLGVFGCSALYVTTRACRRPRGGLPWRDFAKDFVPTVKGSSRLHGALIRFYWRLGRWLGLLRPS